MDGFFTVNFTTLRDSDMRGQERSLMVLLILLLFFITLGVLASPVKPTDRNTIVARWDADSANKETTLPLQQRLEKAAWHIEQGQYAGQANKHYGRARALLSPLFTSQKTQNIGIENHHMQSYLLYLWARVLQHQHHFSQALEHLEQSIRLNPNNSSAIFLKANVLLTQGLFAQSKQTCAQLLGKADLLLTSACVLEVMANQDQLATSYSQLTQLLNQKALPSNQQEQDWLLQLVAEMALKLNKASEAQDWLAKGLNDQQGLAQKPLSFIVLWADIQLSLANEQRVLQQLASIVEQAEFKDDAVLTRLSLAEKSTGQLHWQTLLAERIALRLARQDNFHSADIARFYLDIAPNPEQALFWAQVNWQQAKLYDDKHLLHRALLMQNNAD